MTSALVAPLIAISVVAVVLAVLPAGAVARVGAPRVGDVLSRVPLAGRAAASRLTPLVADVTPPPYAGAQASSIEEPSSIRALVGSAVTLQGRGQADGIVAVVGRDTLHAQRLAPSDRWSISLVIGSRAAAVRLADREFARIVALEPIIDAEPALTLRAPARDSVVRTSGRIALSAEATDDYGVVDARFEYIVSSGEGETFKFRSGTLGAVHPGNARRVALAATLALDSMGLRPGDVVHVRALARDANTATGPGVGASETRAIRVARAGEYDSVAVEAAAPSDEAKSVISERMLITLAEALEKRGPSLQRPVLLGESHAIASDQTRLRKEMGGIIFARLGAEPGGEESNTTDVPARARTMEELLRRADSATNISADPLDFAEGESPVVAVNKPLLEAYNAMWEASGQLELGEPGHALPHMRRALAAIEKARQAERIYLRGRPPHVVVDLNKVRMQGKEKGLSNSRPARPAADSGARHREERFGRIITLAAREPSAAVDSLLLLRIESLDRAPSFADALGAAADALRRGQSERAADALVRARRALTGTMLARDTLSRWGVTP